MDRRARGSGARGEAVTRLLADELRSLAQYNVLPGAVSQKKFMTLARILRATLHILTLA
jgi:hypothetical protein